MTTPNFQAACRGLPALLALILAACGGGSSSDGGASPTVSNLSASTLRYSRTMSVTVSGQALDQGIEMETDNVCTDITKLGGGSDATQTFTCRVGSVGEYNIKIRSTGGKSLASLRVNVPLPQVTLNTSKGAIVVELDLTKAPLSVDNFLRYVNAVPSYYNGKLFHRVEKDFVIQAGGFKTGLVPDTAVHAPIALESRNGLNNLRGTIGMAREAATAASATSQFYFNLKDNPELDYKSEQQPGFAVFGKIVTGLEVIDAIGAVPVRFDLTNNLVTPAPEVLITSASQTK